MDFVAEAMKEEMMANSSDSPTVSYSGSVFLLGLIEVEGDLGGQFLDRFVADHSPFTLLGRISLEASYEFRAYDELHATFLPSHSLGGHSRPFADGDSGDDLYHLGQDRKISASLSSDILLGTSSADLIKGLKGADTLIGGRGNDRLFGGQGKDDLRGGAGEDRLFGGSGADKLTGGAGADVLRGGGGADRLFGGKGADRIFADGADRSVNGGKGADQISLDLTTISSKSTRIDGGQGKDKLVLHIDYDRLSANEIAAFSEDVSSFQAFLADGTTGAFRFKSFALNVGNIEQLVLREKGDPSPVSGDDAGQVSENNAVSLDLLANDDQALGVSKLNGAKVEIGETIITEFGAIRLTSASVIEFSPSRAAQALNDGEVLNATFTYQAIAENGREGAETLVTIQIDGVSDPLITLPAAISGAPLNGVQGEEIVLSGLEVKLPGDSQAILRVVLELEGGSVGFTDETDISALTIVDGDGLDGALTFEGTAEAIAEALANSLSLRVLDADKVKSLVIKATSAATGAAVDQVAIAIDPQVNTLLTPPSAFDDAFDVRAEGRLEGNLLSNDRANEGGALKLFNTTTPANGVLITADDGTFSYQPNAGFSGEDTFQYAVLEDGLLSSAATVVITVLANQAPTANGDTAVTAEDAGIIIDVLANDTDPEGDPLTVKEASALFGAVEINADGTLTYTPPQDFNGTDRVSYTVSDGSLTDVGDVRVQVSAVNDAPVAVGDAVTVDEDTVIVFDVLANDLDADGDPLQISEVSANAGEILVTDEGLLRFIPDLNFNGAITITYTISDGELTDTAHADLVVNPVNDAPILRDDFDPLFFGSGGSGIANRFFFNEDEPRRIDLLGNDFDPDGDDIFIASVVFRGFPEGSVTVNDDNTLTIVSTSEGSGLRELEYTVSDGAASTTGFLQLVLTAVNDPPTGVADRFSVVEDTVLDIDAADGVLVNDFDPDLGLTGQGVTDFGRLGANLLSGPENGTFDFRSDGSFTYLPDEDFNGSDSFTYKPNDGVNSGESTLVTIDVAEGNDPPVLRKCFIGVVDFDNPFNCVVVGEEDQQSEIPLNQLAFDPDDDPLEITNVQFVSNALTDVNPGMLEIVDGDRIVFTPTENFAGDAFFTFTISDGEFSVQGQGRILVRGRNDAPTANPDSFTIAEDSTLIVSGAEGTGNLLDNDVDPDSSILALEVLERPQHGEFLSDPFFEPGSFAYQPNRDFTGIDTFTYRLSDGETFSQPTEVTILVTPIADAAAPVADSYSVLEDEALVVPAEGGVLANDINVDGNTLTATVIEEPENGFLVLAPDGSFTYTPAENFNGVDTFTYIAGGGGGTAVTITVDSVNDVPVGVPDTLSTAFEQPLDLDLTANDFDADGDAITSVILDQPQSGTLSFEEALGRLTYIPDKGFSGVDTFSYAPSDGVVTGEAVDVVITVSEPTADLVFGIPDFIRLTENSGIFAGALLENDFPLATAQGISGLSISNINAFFAVPGPTGEFFTPISRPLDAVGIDTFRTSLGGTVTLTASGIATYLLPGALNPNDTVAPEIDELGPGDLLVDSFSYVLSGTRIGGNFPGSQTVTSAPVEVRIEIGGVDDAPVSSDAAINLDEDQAISGVLPPAFDAEGDAFVYSAAAGPSHGALEVLETGSFTYTPDSDFSGADSFDFAVTSITGIGSVHTVDVSVAPIADAISLEVSLDADPVPDGGPVAVTIAASLQDNDGSETLTDIVISALPFGARLSAGETLPDGRIRLNPETDLINLTLTVDDLSSLTPGVDVSADTDQSLAIFDPNGISDGASRVSAAGDFNGDGIADIALSLPRFDFLDADLPFGILDTVPVREDTGLIAVIFGQEDRQEDFDLSEILSNSEGILIVGPQDGSTIGGSKAIGDVNGDGFDDLAILGDIAQGDPAVIISGAATAELSPVIDLADLQASQGAVLEGAESFNIQNVTRLDDLNSDGFADFSVISNSPSLSRSVNQVVMGSETLLDQTLSLTELENADPLTIIIQGMTGELLGDINGDGRADLFFPNFLGAPVLTESGGLDRAVHAYVVLATETGFPEIEFFDELDGSNGFQLSDPFLPGRLQSSINALGDINDDGFQDFAVSVPQTTSLQSATLEQISVLYGSDLGFTADIRLDEPDGEVVSAIINTSDNLGGGLNVFDAGDVNGDGFDDLVRFNTVLFGSAVALPAVLDLASLSPGGGFGVFGGFGLDRDKVLIADDIGDFDGDGIDDLILNELNNRNDTLVHIVFGDDRQVAPDDFELTVTAFTQDTATTGDDFNSVTTGLTVNIASDQPNIPPEATDDVVDAVEDTTISFAPLSNDVDEDGGALSITTANAETGEVSINDDNTLTYAPAPDFAGSDTIIYTISDGQGGIDSASVAVSVEAIADTPILSVTATPSKSIANSSGPDTLVNFRADREQNEPQVNTLPDGRIIITWITQDHEDNGASPRPAARIGQPQADGKIEFGEEFVIGGPIGSSRAPSVLLLDNGNLLFAWGSNPIVAQVMQENPDGSLSFGPRINVPGVISQTNKLVDVTQLSDGELFFVWETAIQDGEMQDGNDKGISGRIVSIGVDGLTLTPQQQFLVNANITGDQNTPQVAALSENRALITFRSEDLSAGDANGGIAARIATLVSDGQVTLTDEFRVNQSDLIEVAPQVTLLSDGRVVFVWGNGDVISRVGDVNPDGSVTFADEQIVNERQFGTQTDVQVAELSNNRLLFTWLNRTEDPDAMGSSFNIKARIGEVGNDGAITFVEEFFANEIRDSIQSEPMVAALGDGRAVVVWTTRSGPDVPEPFIGPQLEISARVIDVPSQPTFDIEISASSSDDDGSETIETVLISGLPEGFSLLQNDQILQSNGIDPLNAIDFADDEFELISSDGFSGSVDLIFTATSVEASNNTQNSTAQSVVVDFVDQTFDDELIL